MPADADHFPRDVSKPDGLYPRCRPCRLAARIGRPVKTYRKGTTNRVVLLDPADLMENVTVSDGECWEWQHALNENGYGVFRHPVTRRSYRAHRYYYESLVGLIPDGAYIDHGCRNRRCCNPAHLSVVTPAGNSYTSSTAKLDMAAVQHIKDAWAAGESQVSIGERLGYDSSNVSRVVRGLMWTEAHDTEQDEGRATRGT
jgi:hypothetical protein